MQHFTLSLDLYTCLWRRPAAASHRAVAQAPGAGEPGTPWGGGGRWSRWSRCRWSCWRSDQELDNFTRRLCTSALATCSASRTSSSLWRAALSHHQHLYSQQVGGARQRQPFLPSFPSHLPSNTDSWSPVFFLPTPVLSLSPYLNSLFSLFFIFGAVLHIIIQLGLFCQQHLQRRCNLKKKQAEKSKNKHIHTLILEWTNIGLILSTVPNQPRAP